MIETPASLLERLRNPGEADAWRRFVQLYTPLLYYWAQRLGVQGQAVADLVQDVFVVLVQQMPQFQYDPAKRFRGWLWTILVNKFREKYRRRQLPMEHGADAAVSELTSADPTDEFDEAEYRHYLAGRALKLMQAEFAPTVWQACWQLVVDGKPASDVAARLGVSIGTVYSSKCRVLSRLRQELTGLLD